MKVLINGEPKEVTTGISIAQLLDLLQIDPRTLAVERNLQLVPRAEHAETELAEGDRVEIVTLVGGG